MTRERCCCGGNRLCPACLNEHADRLHVKQNEHQAARLARARDRQAEDPRQVTLDQWLQRRSAER